MKPDWVVYKKIEIQDIENFRKLFIDYFWGELRQMKNLLMQGQFEKVGYMDYHLYSANIYDMSKYLDPPMSEAEIVTCIGTHFVLQRIRSMDQLVNYLTRIQQNNLLQYKGVQDNRNFERSNSNHEYNVSRNRNYNNSYGGIGDTMDKDERKEIDIFMMEMNGEEIMMVIEKWRQK